MQSRLLLFLVPNQLFIITTALVNIELYQCDTNQTIVESIVSINDTIFNSCDLNCCTATSLNACQVTVKSSADACLGRLCYSGKCNRFLFSKPWPSVINSTGINWPLWIDNNYLLIRYILLILLLIANIVLTLVTMFVVMKSIRHAKMLANKKLRRYSLF